jgi:hypothetical protein
VLQSARRVMSLPVRLIWSTATDLLLGVTPRIYTFAKHPSGAHLRGVLRFTILFPSQMEPAYVQ